MLTLEWVLPGFFVDFFLFSLFPGIKQISDPFLNKKRCLTLLREWSVEDQSNLDFHWVVDMFLYKKVCYPCGSQFSLQGCPGKQLKCIHSLANLKEVKQFQKPTCKYKQIRVKRGKYSCIASCFFILFFDFPFFHMFSHFRNVTPVPMLPFFTFVVASVISLILGHIATVFHRRTLMALPSIRNEVSKEAWGWWAPEKGMRQGRKGMMYTI